MRRIALLLILVAILTIMGAAGAAIAAANRSVDPWMAKPVLPVLMLTAGADYEAAVASLATRASLTEAEVKTLRDIAIREAEATAALLHESDRIVRDRTLSKEEKCKGIENMHYNARLVQIMTETDQAVRELLEQKYSDFRGAIREWWAVETARVRSRDGGINTQADIFSRDVFATQYIGYTNYEIALADKYVKWANRGWDYTYPNPPYTADLYRNGLWVNQVLIREVGPWNEDDNYWDSARRLFQDLPLGKPEAEAAYYDGYNGGKDQFGRTVTNPAGVDLTPAVAADLGLGYLQNAWIRVYYYDLP